MKFTIFMMVALTVSCGKIETLGSAGVGGVRELVSRDISPSESQLFTQICDAMEAKRVKLSGSLPNALNFDVVEKDCSGNTITFNTQQVRVEANPPGYQFRRQDTNGLFVFPQVETKEAGFMKEICGASSLPYISNGQAIWVSSSGFSTTDCPTVSNEQCLVVEYGTRQGTSNSYLINKVEFVRFNLLPTSGKYGYFTHRKSLAENNCDQGKYTESQAGLR